MALSNSYLLSAMRRNLVGPNKSFLPFMKGQKAGQKINISFPPLESIQFNTYMQFILEQIIGKNFHLVWALKTKKNGFFKKIPEKF